MSSRREDLMDASEISVRCCIAGGGPAGMMLGFLLARAGISVLVLEKHADFLRDFRGDTIHPSTLEVMHELGLLQEFLRRQAFKRFGRSPASVAPAGALVHRRCRPCHVPIGGVGINLAVQDAVAAANILAPRFLQGAVSEQDLEAVQRHREFPTRATQRLQIILQNRVIGRVLKSGAKLAPPLALRLFGSLPLLRRIPARLIGLGFRPEHVKAPAAAR
jgi:2-polyprenyl-6-methoxyphenol hydroxylase-like FAD-dependent oxidoreductase